MRRSRSGLTPCQATCRCRAQDGWCRVCFGQAMGPLQTLSLGDKHPHHNHAHAAQCFERLRQIAHPTTPCPARIGWIWRVGGLKDGSTPIVHAAPLADGHAIRSGSLRARLKLPSLRLTGGQPTGDGQICPSASPRDRSHRPRLLFLHSGKARPTGSRNTWGVWISSSWTSSKIRKSDGLGYGCFSPVHPSELCRILRHRAFDWPSDSRQNRSYGVWLDE